MNIKQQSKIIVQPHIVQPLKVSRWTQEALVLNNLFIQSDLAITVDTPIGHWRCEGFNREANLPDKYLLIQLEANDQSFDIAFDLDSATRLMGPWLQGIDLESIPAPLLEAAIETAFESIAPSLSDYFSCAIKLRTISLNTATAKECIKTVIAKTQLQVFGQSLDLFIRASSEQVALFTKSYTTRCRNNTNVRILAHLSYGYTHLSLPELEDLELGDVIFFDECFYKTQCFLMSIGKETRWLAKLDDKQFVIVEQWNPLTMNEEISDTPTPVSNNGDSIGVEQQGLPNLDSLPMTLNFELPKHQLSLDDVKSLGKGYIFDLQASPSSAVSIVVNGKMLGQGELVNVEDKLGVRVTHWGQDGS